MQSMTGYGRGTAALGAATLIVDLRSVNHRFFELRLHLTPELTGKAALLEEVARQAVSRGRVDLSARIEGPPPRTVQLDHTRARAAFAELEALQRELAPSEPLPMSLLGTVPGLFREAGGPGEPAIEQACRAAAELACRELLAMRRAEGARLAQDLVERCEHITRELAALQPTLPALVRMQQDKLRGRIAQLLGPNGLPVDSARIEHEIAVLADRADISEELTRLDAHANALLPLLRAASDEPVGHRLDFLLQEMTREANTSAAKLPDAKSTQTMLAIKAELLRMREQVQNVL
ncbi:MAG TPA: DUF1732 domain-containing protein [Polyangiales bacterium]|jgi:uncharacterized protein (TIGR00255 family)|nr:DUF1732 domain-containing protein [Polyangiales bacterium]